MKTEMDECDNFFCLYWMANRCLLSYITLDSCGCCENCIHMELPEPLIHRWRLDQLRKLENGETNRWHNREGASASFPFVLNRILISG